MISLSPHLHIPSPFSTSVICLMVSVDVEHHGYLRVVTHRARERSRTRWSWAVMAGWILVLLSCSSTVASWTLFLTLFHTAVKTVISEVYKLLGTGGVPTSLTLLFWRWLTVSSVFTGRSARTSYSSRPPFPVPNKPYVFCGRKAP